MRVSHNGDLSLGEIYKRYVGSHLKQESRIILPLHQRGSRWDQKKTDQWIETIESCQTGLISSQITLYILESEIQYGFTGGMCPVKLNDGSQRTIYSIENYIEKCRRLNKDPYELLNSVRISAQYVIYKDTFEAIKYFLLINAMGTTATPLELTKGLITQAFNEDSFRSIWEPKIDRISTIVGRVMSQAIGRVDNDRNVGPKKIPTVHKRIRDDIGLFYRFLSEDTTKAQYKTSCSVLHPSSILNEKILEKKFADLVSKLLPEEMDKKLDAFDAFLSSRAAFYKQKFAKINGNGAYTTATAAFRWIMSFFIYCENNNIDQNLVQEFVELLIEKSKGKSSIFYLDADGQKCNTNLSTGNLVGLSTIKRTIGFEKELEPRQRRKKPSLPIEKGFVHSHDKAYSHSGNGETVPENSWSNSLRSNRDMTEEERGELEAFNSPNAEKNLFDLA